EQSLMSAVSIGMATRDIIDNEISQSVIQMIEQWTSRFAKVKLVLQKNKYYLESTDPTILQLLLQDDEINNAAEEAWVQDEEEKVSSSSSSSSRDKYMTQANPSNEIGSESWEKTKADESLFLLQHEIDKETDDDILATSALSDTAIPFRFAVAQRRVETVRRRCQELGYPTLEEYAFRDDPLSPSLRIDLKFTTTVRNYQEKSLSKMFGGGRAHSGLIVLPCGAGKTLVAITAASTIRKSVIVVCMAQTAVIQWKEQMLQFANVDPTHIITLVSGEKELIPIGLPTKLRGPILPQFLEQEKYGPRPLLTVNEEGVAFITLDSNTSSSIQYFGELIAGGISLEIPQ
ncbi:MAG: putative transcription factor TFIIH complex ERCC-3 subunit, partial [Streblomastix strix]